MVRALYWLGMAAAIIAASGCGQGEREPPGQPPLSVAVSPGALAFSATPIGFTRTATIEVQNTGGAPLQALMVLADGAAFAAGPAPAALSMGQTIRVLLSFSPAAAGEARGAVFIRATGVPTATVALTGIGVPRPACSDANPCTTDVPQIDGTCLHQEVAGPCDDGNACTESDACFDGRCLGSATACEPPAECLAGLCDIDRGCVFVAAASACDDHEACTIDACTNSGCTHQPAPDGTPCGTFEQCVSAPVCMRGSCTPSLVADHRPCSDGDSCTDHDACSGQRCVGAPVTRSATVSGFAPTFGGPAAMGAILADGRLVLVDPLPWPKRALATVLVRTSTQMLRQTEELHPEFGNLQATGTMAATSTGTQLAIVNGDGILMLYDVDGGGRLLQRGSVVVEAPFATGRVWLVPLGRRWYACGALDNAVSVLDARDPDAPRNEARIPLARSCTSLAVDPARHELLVGTGLGQLERFSLQDPSTPTPLDGLLSEASVVATNGRLVATAGGATITLRRPDDLGTVGAFDAADGLPFVDVIGLHFAADRLFVQTTSGLTVWDLSAPAPRRMFTVDGSGTASPAPSAPDAIATDGRTVVRAGLGYADELPLILDVGGAEPRSLEHPARGGVQRLVEAGGALYGIDQYSVHLIDKTQRDRPAFQRGAWVRPYVNTTLWSLGPAAGPPRFFAAESIPGRYGTNHSGQWIDGRDPDAPLVLTPAFNPFGTGALRAVDDGHRAFAVHVSTSGDRAQLFGWDLDLLRPSTIETAFAGASMLDLSGGPLETSYNTLAFDGGRAVVALTEQFTRMPDAPEQILSRLLVADISAYPRTALEAQASLSGYVVSAAVQADRVLVVLKTSRGIGAGDFAGEVLRSYRVSGGALIVEGEVALQHASRVLEATTTQAIVSTIRGAAFLSLGPTGPAVVGTVDLWESPTSAMRVDERVWFAGPHGIGSVLPPCP
ncbi:MAG: hypothetical protein U1E65_13005 [Myxococcota bacterium]